jgi:AcrR family transcriptional regulator
MNDEDYLGPTAATASPRRGNAREEAILNAAIELVAEIGYDRITVDRIAARAKASKATMYRRWPGKAELVAEALRRHAEGPATIVEDTGSLRGDLLATVRRLVRSITGDRGPSLLGLLEAIRDHSELRVLIAGQIQSASEDAGELICARAAARGELAAHAGDAAALLRLAIADLLLQTLLTGHAPGPADQQRLTDDVLVPLLTRAPRGSAGTP